MSSLCYNATTLADNVSRIVDALRCALVSFELVVTWLIFSAFRRHIQAENSCTDDIRNLCNEAKSLQAKLRDKKCLIISHFQNVVSNLAEENWNDTWTNYESNSSFFQKINTSYAYLWTRNLWPEKLLVERLLNYSIAGIYITNRKHRCGNKNVVITKIKSTTFCVTLFYEMITF